MLLLGVLFFGVCWCLLLLEWLVAWKRSAPRPVPGLKGTGLDLLQAKNEPGDCGNDHRVQPAWFDRRKFELGKAFFAKHTAIIDGEHLRSLIAGFALRSLQDPMIFTKRSEEVEAARDRLLRTLGYVASWHDGDVWDPNSAAYHSLQDVRSMHKRVVQQMAEAPDAPTPHFDPIDLKDAPDATKPQAAYLRRTGTLLVRGGVFMSQYDMVLTQVGFVAVAMSRPWLLRCTDEEVKGYLHFWRCVGYLLGISDKYNACQFDDDLPRSMHVFNEIKNRAMEPAIIDGQGRFLEMSQIYMDAITSMLPPLKLLLSRDAFLAIVCVTWRMPKAFAALAPRMSPLALLQALVFLALSSLAKWCWPLEMLVNLGVAAFARYQTRRFNVGKHRMQHSETLVRRAGRMPDPC